MKKLCLLLVGSLLVLSSSAFAASCTPLVVKVQNKHLILPGVEDSHQSQVYYLHNTSQTSLWLDHPVEHKSASAGWSSYLRAGRWSALLLNRKNFAISCSVIQPGKVDVKDCAKVITVCVPSHRGSNSKRKGSYWLAEDQTWEDLLRTVEMRLSPPKHSL